MSTRRIAYVDGSSGVSGDKLLGALLDVGTDGGGFTAEYLRAIVSAIAPEARIDVDRVRSHGISALSVRVSVESEPPHRHWSDIAALIATAALPDAVREASLRTFEALAVAEAAVHGVALDDVHFHEVGAIDSIVDMVGVCAGAHALGIEAFAASPIAVGSGTVKTSHGLLPVPAPATAMLLADVPVTGGPVAGELTTPTGAALLKGLAFSFGTLPPMTIDRIGRGAGTRDIGMPNVCQLVLGEENAGSQTDDPMLESVVVLETNIDHLSAEELAFVAEELLSAGALDVWQMPIVMKKGRAAVMLGVLAAPDAADALTALTMSRTGSLGVRRRWVERACAPRDIREVDTPWGPARVKLGAGRVRPEHDDVARIAREHDLPYATVAEEIARIAQGSAPSQ